MVIRILKINLRDAMLLPNGKYMHEKNILCLFKINDFCGLNYTLFRQFSNDNC